jgi:hypothetical protein
MIEELAGSIKLSDGQKDADPNARSNPYGT